MTSLSLDSLSLAGMVVMNFMALFSLQIYFLHKFLVGFTGGKFSSLLINSFAKRILVFLAAYATYRRECNLNLSHGKTNRASTHFATCHAGRIDKYIVDIPFFKPGVLAISSVTTSSHKARLFSLKRSTTSTVVLMSQSK